MTKKPLVLAFVPHKTGADQGKPDDRRFINTHLSRLAADKRRHGKPKPARLQQSSGTLKAPKIQISRLAQKPPAVPDPIERSEASASGSTGDSSQDEFTESSDTSTDSEHAHAQSSGGLPLTVATAGYHDPFMSTEIPITSEVQQLLTFNANMFTPWAIGIEKGEDKQGAFGNKFAQTSLQALGNKGTGYANLARLAVAAASVSSDPRLDILAARFKMMAYASLRESMEARGNDADLLLLTQVFSLVSMESTARQDDIAALHTRTLRQLIRSDPEPIKLDKKLLSSVCWHESMRTGLTSRRPILNIETFVDSTPYLRALFTTKLQLEALDLWPPSSVDGFGAANLDARLVTRLREMRFIHDLSHALQSAPQLVVDPLMEAYGFRASFVYCDLFDIYNDIVDKLRTSPGYGYDIYQLYTESSVAMCASYSLRAITSHEPIDIDNYKSYMQLYSIYATHKPLLAHLREAYHYCKMSDGLGRQAHVWLWILRIATLAERASMFPRIDPAEIVSGFFHRAFVTHAQTAFSMRRWENIELLLGAFLRMDGFRSASKMYFDLAVAMGKEQSS